MKQKKYIYIYINKCNYILLSNRGLAPSIQPLLSFLNSGRMAGA